MDRKAYGRRWAAARRRRLDAAGLCSRCGGPRDIEGRRECSRCRETIRIAYHSLHRDKNIAKHKIAHRALKTLVFEHYGGCKCACCGDSMIEFLSIDHIKPVGHNRKRRGFAIYAWLKRHAFPEGYRVLCMNCNFALGHFGYCPHRPTEIVPNLTGRRKESS